MNYYQLLVGRHQDLNKRDYKPGDVIETDKDLVKSFGTMRFRKLSETAAKKLIAQAQTNKKEL